jgi:uncharacterized RDD family membrane protein YckC
MTPPRGMPEPSLIGHYAGAVTRTLAHAIDAAVSVAAYAVLISVTLYVVNLVSGAGVTRSDVPAAVWSAGLALWVWLYYSYAWGVSGQTLGMVVVGVRVVRRDGAPLAVWQAVVRPPALALSFATLGIGFVGILVGRERRGLQDVLAGTVVVYAWDARTARLRFLARQTDPRERPASPVDVASS